MTIEDPLLSAHGYQLLSIATSYLVSNNKEIDVSDIFWGVLFIVGWGELMTIEGPITECPWLSIVVHSNQFFSG